jgi:hypothetical protein
MSASSDDAVSDHHVNIFRIFRAAASLLVEAS